MRSSELLACTRLPLLRPLLPENLQMIFTHDDEHVSSVTDSASDHDSGSRSWREHERTVSTGGGRYILSDTHGQSERHRDSAERSNRSITRTASSLL